MFGILAGDVQVRKEDWGLLFYSSSRHKVRFVRSGNWLYPYHFDGSWTFSALVDDIAKRSHSSYHSITRNLLKVIDNLSTHGLLDKEASQTISFAPSQEVALTYRPEKKDNREDF